MAQSVRPILWSACVALLAGWGCEQVIGADFDEKALLQPGTGGSGGTGGTSGGGGVGGSGHPLGHPCVNGTECGSGICADEVCCDSECEGDCQQCDLEGSEGTCSPYEVLTPCGSAPPGVCDGSGACATGAPIWNDRFGGGGEDLAKACAFDAAGELYVVGEFHGTLDLGGDLLDPTLFGQRKVFIAKVGRDGAHRWSAMLDSDGEIYVNDVAVDSDGGVAIIGNFDDAIDIGGELLQHSGPGPWSGFILKLNGDGAHLWSTVIKSPLLGAEQEIAIDASGNVVAAGLYSDPVEIDGVSRSSGGDYGTFIARFESDGTLAWLDTNTTVIGAPRSGPSGIQIGSTGDLFVLGFWRAGDIAFGGETLVNADAIGQDVFLVRMDPEGNVIWANRYGANASQFAGGLAIDGQDRLGFVGSFNATINFGSGSLTNLSATGNNVIVELDVFAGMVDEDATHLWSEPYGTFFSDKRLWTRVGSDQVGNLALIGRTEAQPVDMGNGSLPATSLDGAFFSRVGVDGTTLWSKAFDASGTGTEGERMKLMHVASAPDGTTAVCGWLAGETDLGTGTLTSDPGGSKDILIGTFEP
ncbi:MAG: hypothetical protein JRI68_00240 [Deltaproteobacteria bacterium]|nr:hypothetical protein [Deltaproteobacteria bacterium]